MLPHVHYSQTHGCETLLNRTLVQTLFGCSLQQLVVPGMGRGLAGGPGHTGVPAARRAVSGIEPSQRRPHGANVSPIERAECPTASPLTPRPACGPCLVPANPGPSGLDSLQLHSPWRHPSLLASNNIFTACFGSCWKGFVSRVDTKQGERRLNARRIESYLQKVPAPCVAAEVGPAPKCPLLLPCATAGPAWGCQGTPAACKRVPCKHWALAPEPCVSLLSPLSSSWCPGTPGSLGSLLASCMNAQDCPFQHMQGLSFCFVKRMAWCY